MPESATAQSSRQSTHSAITHFDEAVTVHKKSDFRFEMLRATYYDRVHERFGEDDFLSLGLSDEDGLLTNAGMLFADDCVLPQSRIRCIRWEGLQESSAPEELLDDYEYKGCLLRLLREGLAFAERNNLKSWKKIAGPNKLNMHSHIDSVAEEALLNALAHRDYRVDEGVTISVFANRIEIVSPGGKVDGKSLKDTGASKADNPRRNPLVADLLRKMRFGEDRDTGLRFIRERTALAPNYKDEFKPQFSDNGKHFKVILWNMNCKEL